MLSVDGDADAAVEASSFWYQPTRVVPDQTLNSRFCCCCYFYIMSVCVCVLLVKPSHWIYKPALFTACPKPGNIVRIAAERAFGIKTKVG